MGAKGIYLVGSRTCQLMYKSLLDGTGFESMKRSWRAVLIFISMVTTGICFSESIFSIPGPWNGFLQRKHLCIYDYRGTL